MKRQRKIIHIDQDCFYAAVEIRDDPSLRGRPVAVGGSAKNRGVLTTANYEARKFGVHAAMSTARALNLCPQLVLVPVHFEKYRAESQKIRAIFKKFTEKIEPLSLDEAYLDVTECRDFNSSATLIAQDIRRQIFKETKLTASAGIAPNKFLAKIASDWNKPNGQFTVFPKMIDDFVGALSIEKIPGVGKVTAKKMHTLGIKTCKDLQRWSLDDLSHQFGVWGIRLFDLCRGQDNREVSTKRIRKSLSVENTFNSDLQTVDEALNKTSPLYKEFITRLEKSSLEKSGAEKIQALIVKVKFHDFTQTTFEQVFKQSSEQSGNDKKPSLEAYKKMVEVAINRKNKPVRLIGLGVKFSVRESRKAPTQQMDLF